MLSKKALQKINSSLAIMSTYFSFQGTKQLDQSSTKMDEPNKMISTLMDSCAKLESERDQYIEDKKKFEDQIKKLNLINTEAMSYKKKFNEICDQSVILNQELKALKQKMEEKDKEIEAEKNYSNDQIEMKNSELADIKESVKETENIFQDLLKKKDKEISDLYDQIEQIRNTPSNEREEELIEKYGKLKEQKDQLDKNLSTQNSKLVALADAYKKLTSNNNKLKEDYELYTQSSQAKLNEKQALTKHLNDELGKMKKMNKDSTDKLNEALSFIKTLQDQKDTTREEYEAFKMESNEEILKLKEKANKSSASVIGLDQIKDLVTECMLSLYKLEESFTYHDMIEKTLMNFNLITQSAFESINASGSVSIYQENIKDIFFKIYSLAHSKQISLNGESLSKDVVNALVNDIIRFNPIRVLEEKNYVEAFANKIAALDLDEDANNEILAIYDSKTKVYQQSTSNILKTLIEKCSSSIKNDAVVINKKECFSFKCFILGKLYVKNGILFIDNNNLTDETSEYVINLIKYPEEKIHTVEIVGSFLKTQISKMTIKKILFTIMTYLPLLECFVIKECELTSKIIQYIVFTIENLKQVKTIHFESNRMNDEDMKLVYELLKHNKTITELRLIDDNITSVNGFYLSDCLTFNKTIRTLVLSNNKLIDEGLRSIFNIIGEMNITLEELDLSNNRLREEDFGSISNFLAKNPPIKRLALTENILNMASSVLLGSSLDKTTNLKRLELCNMNISADLTPILFKKCNFEELILDDNPLDEIGHIMLAKALNSNNSIRIISLKNTKISAFGLTHMLNCIKQLKSIEELHLENNVLDYNGIVIISSFAKDKTVSIFISKEYVTSEKVNIIFEKITNVVLI